MSVCTSVGGCVRVYVHAGYSLSILHSNLYDTIFPLEVFCARLQWFYCLVIPEEAEQQNWLVIVVVH